MTEHETLMYCTGLFDGEGSACIVANRNCYKDKKLIAFAPVITLTMTDKEPVCIFAEYCCGKVYPIYSRTCSEKTYYQFIVNGRQAGKIAKKLLPTVKIQRKREALECVIKLAETMGPPGSHDYVTPELRKYRLSLHKQCAECNNRVSHFSINEEPIIDYTNILDSQLSFL